MAWAGARPGAAFRPSGSPVSNVRAVQNIPKGAIAMGTVVALFRTYDDADRAVTMLNNRGFERSSVGVVAQESVVEASRGDGLINGRPVDAVEGAGEGAVLGGLAGLLVGVVALAIPGIGPLFVAGALASVVASTLAGATAGAVTGGLLGALTDLGIPEEEAKVYHEGVKAGGVLVSVDTNREAEAADILRSANATNVHEGALVPR
jgi:hypothetical protein